MTLNPTLTNLKETIDKHWHIPNISPDYRETFKITPIIGFRKKNSLKKISGTNIIKNNRKYLTPANFFSKGKRSLCYDTRTMCSKQVNTTTIIASNETSEIFNIYNSLNCKSKYIIYLLECSITKVQYVRKSKTPLNNHRKDIKDPSQIPACKHFNSPNHDFTEIQQLRNFIVQQNS